MTAVHKKREEKKEPSSAKATEGQGEKAQEVNEPVVVSNVVTKTTERIEVIDEVIPDEPKSDPLTDFKEKMNEEEHPKSDIPQKKNFMWPILFVFLIALVLLSGIFIYKQSVNKDTKINVVSLSPQPSPSPEPTKAKIDLSKYEIKILNGSEVEGEAGRQKSNLESEGFTVSSVGNADDSNYKETIIQAKKEVDKDFLDKLKSVLQSSFTLGEIKELSDDSLMPIVIIIGSKKA